MAAAREPVPVPQAVEEAAQALHEARRNGQRIDLVSSRWPQIGVKDARVVAQRFVDLGGEPHVGFKLGFTSAAMRIQMGIAEPNYGLLTADMGIDRLDWPRLIHPRVEPEIALVTSRPIVGLIDVTSSAIASVHAAIEIVDTRYTEYRFSLIDNTADNSSAAGFILGQAWPVSILESSPVMVTFDDGEGRMISGSSDDALGGPLQALAWLADARAKEGLAIPAGAIILTGGLTRAPHLPHDKTLTARFGRLGELSVRWMLVQDRP
jgi:2-keto-4-pentenoate hydratase